MSDRPRSVYARELVGPVPAGADPAGLTLRLVEPGDDPALGGLMERAYAETIDDDLGDNDDGAVEIADWRATGAAPAASVVATSPDGAVASACLVSRDCDGTLWISYVITDPSAKGKGVARAVVTDALRRLHASDPGERVLAGVTDGNTPSERLLVRLGFQRLRAV